MAADRFLLPAAGGGDAQIRGGSVTALAGVLRQAGAAAAGFPTVAEVRLSGRGLCVLERIVRAGEDAAGIVAKLYQETQKAIADRWSKSGWTRSASNHLVMVAAGVPEVLRGRCQRHRRAREKSGNRKGNSGAVTAPSF